MEVPNDIRMLHQPARKGVNRKRFSASTVTCNGFNNRECAVTITENNPDGCVIGLKLFFGNASASV